MTDIYKAHAIKKMLRLPFEEAKEAALRVGDVLDSIADVVNSKADRSIDRRILLGNYVHGDASFLLGTLADQPTWGVSEKDIGKAMSIRVKIIGKARGRRQATSFSSTKARPTSIQPAAATPETIKTSTITTFLPRLLGLMHSLCPDGDDGIHTTVANAKDGTTDNKLDRAVKSSLDNEANSSNNSGNKQGPTTTNAVLDVGNSEGTDEASDSVDGDNCSCRRRDVASNNAPITLL